MIENSIITNTRDMLRVIRELEEGLLNADLAISGLRSAKASITQPTANRLAMWDSELSMLKDSIVRQDTVLGVTVGGFLNISTCVDAGVDTDKFLVLDGLGDVDYRTGAELLSDIGGVGGSGTTNYVTKFTDGAAGTIGNSQIIDNGTNVGVGGAPSYNLHVIGSGTVRARVTSSTGAATLDIEGIGGTSVLAQQSTGALDIYTGAGDLMTLNRNGGGIVTYGNLLSYDGTSNEGFQFNSNNNIYMRSERSISSNQPYSLILIDNTAMASGVGGALAFQGAYSTAPAATLFGGIRCVKANGTNGNYESEMVFSTRLNGANCVDQMWIDGNGNVGIGTSTPSEKLGVNGSVFIEGDAYRMYLGGGKDASIHYDGTDLKIYADLIAPSDLVVDCGANKTIELETSVWDDQQVNLGTVGFGASAPTWTAYKDSKVLSFDKAQDNKITFTLQYSHRAKRDVAFEFHVHNTATDITAGEVRWVLTVSFADIGDDFSAVSTFIAHQPIAALSNDEHLVFQIEDDIGVTNDLSCVALCSLMREGTHSADTYDNDIYLVALDSHFQIDTMGSRQENSK